MTDHNADAGAGGSGTGSLDPAMTDNGDDQGLVEAASAVAQEGGRAPENDQVDNNNNNNPLRRVDNNSASAAAADSSSSNDLAKKKRVADRQITQFDREDEDDSSMVITGEFTKADTATLAKRRILKAKRPVAQHDESTSSSAKGETATNSNPFAGVKLSSSTTKANNTSSVDGATASSSNPFAAIALKAGGSSSSTGTESAVFGSGSGFMGFGNNKPSTSFAFGGGGTSLSTTAASSSTATTPTTTSLGLFGNSTSTSNGLGTSWFSTPSGSTPFSFASAAAPAAASNDKSETAASADGKKEVLPEHVELSTGEEEEQLMVEVRVKTYKRVLEATTKSDAQDSSMNNPHSNTAGDNDGSTPSVPPSSATAPMVQKANGDSQKVTSTAEKQDKEEPTKNESEDKANVTNGSHLDSAPLGQDEGGAQALPWRWQEVGTGPLRLLGRAVDSNASSPKQCRLVQRRESTPNGPATKVIVNINLWKETTIQRPSEKHVQITTLVESETSSPVPETYLFKLKAPSEANQLQQKLEELVSKAKSCVGSE